MSTGSRSGPWRRRIQAPTATRARTRETSEDGCALPSALRGRDRVQHECGRPARRRGTAIPRAARADDPPRTAAPPVRPPAGRPGRECIRAQACAARSSAMTARGERPASNSARLARVAGDGLHVVEQRLRRVHLRHLALQPQQLLRRERGGERGEQVAPVGGRAAARARAPPPGSPAGCASGSDRAATPAAGRCPPGTRGSASR